jgi:hypothetical protein
MGTPGNGIKLPARGKSQLIQVAEVKKMLHCGDPAYGFATYICLNCGETKRVAFSCKSRVCSSCGKVHADEWSRQLVGRRVRRLNWRERIQQHFQRDPLCCPRCGQPGMELYSLTILDGGKQVTIGGWRWLVARGLVRPARPPPLPTESTPERSPQEPQAVQLSFCFDEAPANVATAPEWFQLTLL